MIKETRNYQDYVIDNLIIFERYMINECDMQEKWVIINLSEDILIDTINLLNLEYFSSNVKKFEVSTHIAGSFN